MDLKARLFFLNVLVRGIQEILKLSSFSNRLKLLHKIYKSIDHDKIYSKHNATAVFYSITKILP